MCDNTIQWIIDKSFSKLVPDPRELFQVPYAEIRSRVFDNPTVIQNLTTVSTHSISTIRAYVSEPGCQELILMERVKDKICVQIMLGNLFRVRELVNQSYPLTESTALVAALNNSWDAIHIIRDQNPKLITQALLNSCARYGYEDLYLRLRELGLKPNLTSYNAAALGQSIICAKDINESIGLTKQIVEQAVKANQAGVVEFIIEQALHDKIQIDANLVTYPLMNSNWTLIELFEKHKLFEWHEKLYYAALLSGSIDTVTRVEDKLGSDLHHNRILDTSHTKKGSVSLLLESSVYQLNGCKYFAHTMNYAVQSNSVQILDHIYAHNYIITVSNITTAIQQSSVEILAWLLDRYDKALPYFVLAYLGISSHIPDKQAKISLIMSTSRLNYCYTQKKSLQDLRSFTIHSELITERKTLTEDCLTDIDYLMSYLMFVQPKPDRRAVATINCMIVADLTEDLARTIDHLNGADKQVATDLLFLKGSMTLIRKIWPLLSPRSPRTPIILELLCYNQIGKLCYIIKNCQPPDLVLQQIYPVALALDNACMLNLFSKKGYTGQNLRSVLLTRNLSKIRTYLTDNPPQTLTDPDLIKLILSLDSVDILKLCPIDPKQKRKWTVWAKTNGFHEVATYFSQ